MDRMVSLMLDSGAFSLWRKGGEIPVAEYIDFLLKNRELIDHIVNLDKIPGRFGKKPSPSEVEESARKGWENYCEIIKEGFPSVLPVYHQGERIYWLEKMINEGCSYIGISPANDRNTDEKMVWLDNVFDFLCGSSGYPQIRTHGFGVTALPILYRYPWGSVDSATWLLVGGFGAILIPSRKLPNGLYDYEQPPLVVTVSSRVRTESNSTDQDHLRFYDRMGTASKKYVCDFLESEGFSIDKARDDYITRQWVNCRFFKKVSQNHEIKPFQLTRKGIFGTASKSKFGLSENRWGKMKVIFTLTTSPEHSDVLQDEGIRDRLLTYYYFRAGNSIELKQYVTTGRLPKTSRETPKKRRKRLVF